MMLYRVVDKFGRWVETGLPKRPRTYLAYSTALSVATRLSTEHTEYRVQKTEINWEEMS